MSGGAARVQMHELPEPRPHSSKRLQGKPIMSQQAAHDFIRSTVAANDVVLFMKGTKQMPQCGFSSQVVQILGYLGVDYKDVNVLADMSIREGIKTFNQWPTVPQLMVKGEFIGGCDIVREMFQSGELQQLLDEKGVVYDKKVAAV
jgi:monothiol glutaredoxin